LKGKKHVGRQKKYSHPVAQMNILDADRNTLARIGSDRTYAGRNFRGEISRKLPEAKGSTDLL